MSIRIQLADSLAAVPAAAWDALAAPAGVLLSHAFLHGLERTGCVGGDSGWQPRHLLAWEDDAQGGRRLAGAVPLYLKNHSYGEYVFDWAWADAYANHGLDYYPKWLAAIPFTPVGGARLLTAEPATRAALAQALVALTRQSGLSSLHVLLPGQDDTHALQAAGCMIRTGTQFHWSNAGWHDFEHFLEQLAQPKRKKIRAERRKVHAAGVTVRMLAGAQICEADWHFFYRCYANTYREHGATPYLGPAFFEHLGTTLPDHCLMPVAYIDGEPIAASLLLLDRIDGQARLYGRYWGALRHIPCLHFELSYYAPIEWAIAHGVARIEGGAQGEHKLARGFLAVKTHSAHWLAHPAFASAVEDFLARERGGLDNYLDELHEHSPFKAGIEPVTSPLAPD